MKNKKPLILHVRVDFENEPPSRRAQIMSRHADSLELIRKRLKLKKSEFVGFVTENNVHMDISHLEPYA